ncbi:MAG: hypothetical protein ABR907_08555 [Terracidiphilus sp.]
MTLTALALSAAMAAGAYPAATPLAQARAALQAGEADKALALLNPLAQAGGPADAFNLKCRAEYMLEQWDRAAGDCEQAVKLEGQNSEFHLWLGRALGEKASRASFLSAYSLAKHVRAEFEEAVKFNPGNTDALADLGEFYYSAPGAVGGGIDKAEGVAAQLEKIDPAQAHELRGHIAVERKDYGTAEREFKQAVAAAAHPAEQWMALAGFYRGRERWAEMESAVRSGESAAAREKHSGVALYNGATLLIRTNRDSARAAKMLEGYLAGGAKSEEAPAFVAHTLLARLKLQSGDMAAAGRERDAALALAQEYKPAQELKH